MRHISNKSTLVVVLTILFLWPIQEKQSKMSKDTKIVLNGDHFEGGGGLIRESLVYACVFDMPIRFYAIRASRPGAGGLRVEHTVAIDTMARMAHAEVQANYPESRTLVFKPHALRNVDKAPLTHIEMNLEGSAGIALNALLPYILFGQMGGAKYKDTISVDGVDLSIRAGTICIKAPSISYLRYVFMPTMGLIGLAENIKLHENYEQGWHTDFVQTRGLIKAWAKPLAQPLPAVNLTRRGRITEYIALGYAPKAEISTYHDILRRELPRYFLPRGGKRETYPNFTIEVKTSDEHEPQQYHLLLVARSETPKANIGYELVYPQVSGFPKDLNHDSDALLEHITRTAVLGLKEELKSGNAVDEHMQNLLVPYQVLSDGWSSTVSPENRHVILEEEKGLVTGERTITIHRLLSLTKVKKTIQTSHTPWTLRLSIKPHPNGSLKKSLVSSTSFLMVVTVVLAVGLDVSKYQACNSNSW